MKRYLLLTIVLVFMATLVAACGTQAAEVVPDGGPATSYDSLVDRVRAKGGTVEPSDDVSQPFFSVKGRVLVINGEQIQVFEYANAAAARAEAEGISADGSSVGTTMITWVDSPHFYQADRLLVLYVGDDADTLALLEEILGPQFAGS